MKKNLVGRVESGNLKKKTKYVISPSNTKSINKIGLEIWPETTKSEYVTGECIGLELNEKIFVEKGNVISEITKSPSLTTYLKQEYLVFL